MMGEISSLIQLAILPCQPILNLVPAAHWPNYPIALQFDLPYHPSILNIIQ